MGIQKAIPFGLGARSQQPRAVPLMMMIATEHVVVMVAVLSLLTCVVALVSETKRDANLN